MFSMFTKVWWNNGYMCLNIRDKKWHFINIPTTYMNFFHLETPLDAVTGAMASLLQRSCAYLYGIVHPETYNPIRILIVRGSGAGSVRVSPDYHSTLNNVYLYIWLNHINKVSGLFFNYFFKVFIPCAETEVSQRSQHESALFSPRWTVNEELTCKQSQC